MTSEWFTLLKVKSFYPSYIRAFVKFAQASFDNRAFLKSLNRFAIIINTKAIELIKRAAKNSRIDLAKLQKEINGLAREYVRKFTHMVKKIGGVQIIKVAIADDHDIFRRGIEIMLKYFPDMNLMINASNGVDLLKQIEMNEPDVVLLDLRMPVMDGLTILQEIKRLHHGIKVIILSMDADTTDVHKALAMGADGYLLKSSDPQVMLKTIRKSCEPGAFNEHSTNARI